MDDITLEIVDLPEEVVLEIDDPIQEVEVIIGNVESVSEYRQEYVEPYHYIGRSAIGTQDDSSYWRIYRIEMHPNGTVTTTQAASVKWTERLTVNYT